MIVIMKKNYLRLCGIVLVFLFSSCEKKKETNFNSRDIKNFSTEFAFQLFEYRESNGGENPLKLSDLGFDATDSTLKWRDGLYIVKYNNLSDEEFLVLSNTDGDVLKVYTSECGIVK